MKNEEKKLRLRKASGESQTPRYALPVVPFSLLSISLLRALEGILRAHACVRWKTIAWAHQIWWREIESPVTVLLKANSLVLWIPYFPTKNVLHEKNRTFSTRVFSCKFFSTSFSWPFECDRVFNTGALCCPNLSVNLKKAGMASRNIVIKNSTRCFKSPLQ